MPNWIWIVIAIAVVIVIVAIVVVTRGGRGDSDRLKQRFGPEYDRTVSEAGDERTAEKELIARERKRDKLDIRPPLSPPAALDASPTGGGPYRPRS